MLKCALALFGLTAEKWANYDAYLPMNIERFCDFYSLGI